LPRTRIQQQGDLGQTAVCKYCTCPKCKKGKLKQLIGGFKCADVICDFCGFVAQVKAPTVNSANEKVLTILGGAWKVQEEKIKAGIYHPLYIVKVLKDKPIAIDYISADFLKPEMFVPRKPLSSQARRAGWQGFYYDLRKLDEHVVVEVWPNKPAITKETALDTKLERFQQDYAEG
jgi:hypothetical protein